MSTLRAIVTCLFLLTSQAAWAQSPPCSPCAGIRVDKPSEFADTLASEPRLGEEERLYVAWEAALDGSAVSAPIKAIAAAGGTPWVVLQFTTAAPLLDHLESLESELREVARLAHDSGPRAHFQIDWRPGGEAADPGQLAFLLKRAAVAINGANSDARVLVGPLPAEPAALRTLYSEEVAAYLDGIALTPAAPTQLAQALATLIELDPGKPVVLDAYDWPSPATRTLPLAAEAARQGIAVTLFDFGHREAAELLPLKLLAREFQGDLAYDPYSIPSGVDGAWTFVRGSDLGLRLIIESSTESPRLEFDDNQLKAPTLIDLSSGEESLIFGQSRTRDGFQVPLSDAGQVSLLRLERLSASELEGIEEELTVETERQLPVEEILRRLQAFEDAQARRLTHYSATNTQHLRFRLGNGVRSIEATFEGDFFYRRGEGFDWAWQNLYINGVRWKSDRLPEIPLIQPEKAAALPLEISLTKDYRYRLRGSGEAEGRDCWIIDFAPIEAKPGLHQGTVWVDRELFARVKTRALQVNLEGEVISNEETMIFSPVAADGQPSEWTADAFYLPLRILGQQLLSVLNATTQLEKETVLTAVVINPEDFERRRDAAWQSATTMVRDTEQGLRYLVKDDDGQRVVKEGFDADRIFLLGGVFYDPSLAFPLPLAGINYLSLDFRGSGNQVNVFFAGALLQANIAEPRLFDSKWDAGASVFGFFIPTNDSLYNDGVEVDEQEVKSANGRLAFFLGRPLGEFTKLDFTYSLGFETFSDADDTAADFVLPEDTLTQTVQVDLSYSRSGWRFAAQGSWNQRDDWQPWGLPGNPDFDSEKEDYTRWEVSLAKTFWLPKFTTFGIEIEHLDGSDLDRFSKYDFGFFSDSSVNGYQSGLVRASEADGLHLTYGLNIGDVFRFEIEGDAVWASDELTGLDRELLAGIGLEGQVIGPWRTLVNFSVGVPVAGPAEDFVGRIFFLKLFGK